MSSWRSVFKEVWAFWRPIYIAIGCWMMFIVVLIFSDRIWRLFHAYLVDTQGG